MKTKLEHSFHHGGLAFNVKCHHLGDIEGATDEQRHRAYQDAQESWWNAAEWLARDYGFDGVYGQGRMGGWCLPYGGQGSFGRHGYTREDLEERSERAKDARRRLYQFAKALAELFDRAPAMYLEALEFCVEEAAEEAAKEAAEEAARLARLEAERRALEIALAWAPDNGNANAAMARDVLAGMLEARA